MRLPLVVGVARIRVYLLFAMITGKCSIVYAMRNSASLAGKLEACTNEGEDVPVHSIQAMDCFKCKCINYFVVCEQQTFCPSVDDCYMLEKKNGCCEKCKDCFQHGIRYASGSEWTAIDDPCSHRKCVAGVITISNLQCYTPCTNPLPPRHGQCCPSCGGCYLNGQHVENGELMFMEDPCVKCNCSNGELVCVKHACPVLQCPVSKQQLISGECCPICVDKRPIGIVPFGKCVLGTGFHENGQLFRYSEQLFKSTDNLQKIPIVTIDKHCSTITNCTCTNGTTICRKRTCPVVECAPEQQRYTSDCCASCPPLHTQILANTSKAFSYTQNLTQDCRTLLGKVYATNQTWSEGPCKSCRCVTGEARCISTNCPRLRCRANETPVHLTGHCCAQCEESAGICTVFGDPHYRTFDGRFYSFMGSCKYQLTGDCANNTFSVRVTNDDRNTRSSAWTKTVTLRLGSTKVNLGQKMRVKVNGTRVLPPFRTTIGPLWLVVTNTSDGIQVNTGLGVQLLWDGSNFLQVSATAARFKNRSLCGLCGNYNGVSRDDLISRHGKDFINETWRFGNSWRVGSSRVCARQNENLERVPDCHRRTHISGVCNQLLDSDIFAKCTGHLNPQYYVSSCRDDMCECPKQKCYCDSFSAYSRECKRLGLELDSNWKAATGCNAFNHTVGIVSGVRSTALNKTRGKRPHRILSHVNNNQGDLQLSQITVTSRSNIQEYRQLHNQQGFHAAKYKTKSTIMPWTEADFMSKHIPKSFLVPLPNTNSDTYSIK